MYSSRPEPYDLAAAIAAGGGSQAGWQNQYHTQLQEILTEEVDNRIFGAATRFKPRPVQEEGGEGEEDEAANEGEKEDAGQGKTLLQSPGPLPPPRTLPAAHPQETPVEETVEPEDFVGSSEEGEVEEPPEGYYDLLISSDDSVFADYIQNYDYGSAMNSAYFSEYAAMDDSYPEPTVASSERTRASAMPTTDQFSESSKTKMNEYRGQINGHRSPSEGSSTTGAEGTQIHNSRSNSMARGTQRENVVNVTNRQDTPGGRSDTSSFNPKTPSHTTRTSPGTRHDEDTRNSNAFDAEAIKTSLKNLKRDFSLYDRDGDGGEVFENRRRTEQRDNKDGFTRTSSQEIISASETATSHPRRRLTEKDKSRIRETEKLIDILDDILREMEASAEFSRVARTPKDHSMAFNMSGFLLPSEDDTGSSTPESQDVADIPRDNIPSSLRDSSQGLITSSSLTGNTTHFNSSTRTPLGHLEPRIIGSKTSADEERVDLTTPLNSNESAPGQGDQGHPAQPEQPAQPPQPAQSEQPAQHKLQEATRRPAQD